MPGRRKQLRVRRGATIKFAMDTPFDLTNFTVAAEIRNLDGNGDLIGTFTCTKQMIPDTSMLGRIAFILSHTLSENLIAGGSDQCFDVKLDQIVDGNVEERIRTEKVWLEVDDYGTQ